MTQKVIENQNPSKECVLDAELENNLANPTVIQSAEKILSKHKYAFEVLGDVKNS